MPNVELISVGTELLLGQLVDTNAVFIAAQLANAGIDVYRTQTVGDNRARIADALREALARADGVVTTGGLGPTVDDLTKEAVCDALGCDTEMHEPALLAMERLFASMRREMRENNRKQAQIPRGAIVLENRNGTAPGFIAFGAEGKFVACMPGVPREMKPMLTEQLVPWLQARWNLREAIFTRVIHTVAIAESEIDHRIGDLFASMENPKIAVLAHEYRCDVKLMAKAASAQAAHALIEPLEQKIVSRLDGHVFGYDGDTLESAILGLLRQRNERIVVAESCTGGRIAAALTAVPGASRSFVGGVVAYENSVKVASLGVDAAKIAREGAVSESVVLEMASGARRRFGADYAVATTGIAGPEGGSPEKPVGLVWFGLADATGASARHSQFRGDRAAIQARATVAALGWLWQRLTQGTV